MKKLLSVVLFINVLVLSGCATKYSDDGIKDPLIQKENLQPSSTDSDKEVSQLDTEDINTQETENYASKETTISWNNSISYIEKDIIDNDWGSAELHSKWKFIRKRYEDGMLSDWKIFYPTKTRELQSQCDDLTKNKEPLLPIELNREDWYKAEAFNVRKIDDTLIYTVFVYEDNSVNLSKVNSDDAKEVRLYSYDCTTNTPNEYYDITYTYNNWHKWVIGVSDRYYYTIDKNWVITVHDTASMRTQTMVSTSLPQWDLFIEQMAYKTWKSKDILSLIQFSRENVSVNQKDEIILTYFHKPLALPITTMHPAFAYWEYYQWKMDIYREN